MTPESVFGVLHLADRFALMLRTLAGKPVPKLPHAPGRRCRPLGEIPADGFDPVAEAWDALEARTGAAQPELAPKHQPAAENAATGRAGPLQEDAMNRHPAPAQRAAPQPRGPQPRGRWQTAPRKPKTAPRRVYGGRP